MHAICKKEREEGVPQNADDDRMTNREWAKNALIMDRDPNWYFDGESKESTEAGLKKAFSVWYSQNSKVTDVLFCIYEQNSMIPSEFVSWRGDIMERYCESSPLKTMISEYGIDPVQLYLDEMDRHGIRPWITLRMNDAHFKYENEVYFIKSDYHFEAVEKGYTIGDEYGYFGRCFDFSKGDYAERMLGYIGEILDRYDMFGLSLDFLREMYCFDYKKNRNASDLMTGFIEKVAEKIKQAGARRGHPIRLLVRVARDEKTCLDFGFDIRRWCREGLVDAVSPCARWECNDSGIPISEWREVVGEATALFGGIEQLMLPGHPVAPDGTVDYSAAVSRTNTSAGQVRGYSAAFLDGGADGILIANMCHDSQPFADIRATVLADLHHQDRTFTVTYQDLHADTEHYAPLPFTLNSNTETVSLAVGRIMPTDRVKITVSGKRFEGNRPVLTVNGIPCPEAVPAEPVILTSSAGNRNICLTSEEIFCYQLTDFETSGEVELDFTGKGTVEFIQLDILSE